MYCGKCGTEVQNNVAFCPNCGNPVQAVTTDIKVKHKVNKKIIIFSIIFVIVIAIIIVGINPVMHILKRPSNEEKIIYVNNMVNGKYATTVGNELWYIAEPDSEYTIYKMNLPTGKAKEVFETSFEPNDFYVENLEVQFNTGFIGGSIDVISNKIKCTEGEPFNNTQPIYHDNYVYTECSKNTDEKGLFVSKNGKSEKQILDIIPNRIIPFNDYVFFISSADVYNDKDNEWKGTWRMDADGDNIIQILEYCPKYLVSDGNLIYYTDENDYLVSADMDGKIIKEYKEHIGDGLNIKDGIIYYSGPYEDGIYSLDSEENKDKITYGKAQGIILANDYIVYHNGQEICCLDLENKENYIISEYDIYDYSNIYRL